MRSLVLFVVEDDQLRCIGDVNLIVSTGFERSR
jgi:hypothetical protein